MKRIEMTAMAMATLTVVMGVITDDVMIAALIAGVTLIAAAIAIGTEEIK